MDWETLAADLQAERAGGALASARGPGALGEEFAYLQTPAASPGFAPAPTPAQGAPMDTDRPSVYRVTVVVDTNALISHLALLERALEAYNSVAAGAATGEQAGPALEVQALVPWIVLNELDRLKGSDRSGLRFAARNALQRLKVLMLLRDAGFRGQTAAEFKEVG